MKPRSLRRVGLALAALALVVVAAWVRFAGGPELAAAIGRMNPAHAPLLVGLTAACVLLRFIRWQYLLRRLGVRVPVRPSLTIYLASLAGIATPAYLGETIRCALLRRSFGVPVRVTLPAWVAERLLDFAAIAVIGAAAFTGSPLVVAAVILVAGGAALLPSAGTGVAALRRPDVLLPVLGLTVLAWLPGSVVLGVALASLGLEAGWIESVRVFAASTLGGGLSLMPAGMGTTGSFAILQLRGVGLPVTDAVAAVSVFRLATAAVTLAVGGAFLAFELRRLRSAPADDLHFDEIAGEYLDQFAPHIWDLLLERKTALIRSALPPAEGALGLDLGCGLGRQALALRPHGYRVIGVDPAHGLLRHARHGGLEAVTGSGLSLPFADDTFDFAYTVGVLHHLTGAGEQEAAVREVARVLRPGGVFVVHETNPRNPLFRLYMGYVFPMLRSIDEGVERWIDARRWQQGDALALERVEYFTFMPDFLPRALLRAVLPLERSLERSPLRRFSVHYMAVLRKPHAQERAPRPRALTTTVAS